MQLQNRPQKWYSGTSGKTFISTPHHSMPLYEYRKNAENAIPCEKFNSNSFFEGNARIAERLLTEAEGEHSIVIDGWYGVNWDTIKEAVESAAGSRELKWISTSGLFRDKDALSAYRKKYIGEDPSFGWANREGCFGDILDWEKVKQLAAELGDRAGNGLTIVYGPAAAVPELKAKAGKSVYCDFTMQPLLWQMWDGALVPFEADTPDPDFLWKQYYYCDFYILLDQKKRTLPEIDLYIDAVDAKNLKLLEASAYHSAIDELVQRPIKQVKITQPGPWGSYRFKEIYDEIPGLENMAWNELAGIELSILIDLNGKGIINIPCQNVMQRPIEMVGEKVHATWPDLLPLQVWLDDGYFAEPVPYERGSMPIHNHPDTDYNKRNFNEPIGRYETYYIVEAYHDAGTMMGFKEDADLEAYESLCRESNNRIAFDWQQYVKRWDTNVGDLFLIPPGTEHGHGGNQMILEMDTGPSVAGTEYSFFTYDFARSTWDDRAKSMTASPMKMHLEHSFRNNKWRREKHVQEHLRARPVVVDGDGDTRLDRYTSIKEMPFEIERFVFTKPQRYSTQGRFLQIPTVTVGKSVLIRSLQDPELEISLDFLQACLIPAGFGDYEFVSPDGSQCTVVMIRLKDHLA